MSSLVADTLEEYGSSTREAMAGYLPNGYPARHLYEPLADYPRRAGKMMRPSICIATARAFGASQADAIRSAAAIELLHNAMLVHDDIQDGSELRRGRPTLHMLHGVPLAINAGDALFLLSLRPLFDNVGIFGSLLGLRILREMEQVAWHSLEGQAIELGWIRENILDLEDADYLNMVLRKTCWLATIHPSRVGALIGGRGALDLEPFIRFGFYLGAAFASPFTLTAPALIESCLRTKTHYLDISGELPVFQNAFLHDEAARGRGIMIMPGAGFGIVASDCLAAHVAALVPNAKYLRIAVRPGLISRGSLRSALGVANSPLSIRRNGRMTLLPVGRLQRAFDFGDGEKESVAVSWADVFTAYHSTGIRNIEAYFEAGFASRALYQLGAGVAGAMQLRPVRALVDAVAGAWPEGPSETRRQAERGVIVAEAEDSWRQIRSARLETPDGYSFTAEAAAAIANRIMRGDFVSGFQTPARVYGADLALQFSGTNRRELRRSFSAQERTMS